MNPVDPTESDVDELAAFIGRELAQLPVPRAPHSLMPRVMAAVAMARPVPRTWFTWPPVWRAMSVAALALLTAGAAWWWPTVQSAMTTVMADTTASVTAKIAARTHGVEAAIDVMSALWRGLQPVVGDVFLLVVVLCAVSIACGAVLGRVALGGASQS